MVFQTLRCFLCLLVTLISQATSRPAYDYTCFTGEDYASNSTYGTNLNTLLSRLTSNTQIDYGFYDSSYGLDSDRVFATGLCRGDVAPDACRSCLNNSSSLLPKHCPHHRRAIAVNDQCMLRYSNHSISGYQDNSEYRVYFRSQNSVTDWVQYNHVLTKLLSRLRVKAATSGDSHDPNRKFAAGHAISASFPAIYAFVQCKPDLTVAECNDCLVGGFSELQKCCKNRSGGGVVKFSCIFRYENSIFYEPMIDSLATSLSPQGSPLPSPLPTESIDGTHHGKSNRSQVIAKAVPAAALVVLLIFVCIYLRVRKPTKHFDSEAEVDNEVNLVMSSQFDFDTIKVATNNFCDSNKLGQCGFGPVYMGRLSNEQVAIKRLSVNSHQGDIEFKNEVSLMAKLQHRNLVRLLGFVLKEKNGYLFMSFFPIKALTATYLVNPIKRGHLDWKTRYKIIEGITRGLLYLHEDSQQRVIHRDRKSSNILLDADMNPKISDFGLTKMFVLDQIQAIASKIAGTFGYMAPEYVRHGKFSVKSDVFSFGVIILEIISGRKNGKLHDGENVEHLLSFAWKNWRKGTTSNIIDPTLDDGSRNEIERYIHIGLLCVQERAIDRPALALVLLMLNSRSFYLPVPMQPAFYMNDKCSSNIYNFVASRSSEQKINSVEASTNEVSISSLYPR